MSSAFDVTCSEPTEAAGLLLSAIAVQLIVEAVKTFVTNG